jgi:hypothetical protein
MSSKKDTSLDDFGSNQSDEQTISFDDKESRKDDMSERIEEWVEELSEMTDEARKTEEFQEWLDVQASFHDYSVNNTLLIHAQMPSATKVAGFNTWRNDFDRHVQEGEDAIWIWAPITAPACPKCGNAESYHEREGCEFDEVPPEEWTEDVVAFRPVPVFDISQTEGEPLPDSEFETTVYGDGEAVWPGVEAASEELSLTLDVIPEAEWEMDGAAGVCKYDTVDSEHPSVEVRGRSNLADLASTTIHEYAHALLHSEAREGDRSMREVEAEATSYVVCRHFGLDASNSAFYLASWAGDDPEVIRERLDRISRTSQQLIDTIAESMDDEDAA